VFRHTSNAKRRRVVRREPFGNETVTKATAKEREYTAKADCDKLQLLFREIPFL
jgi:hypothetical protein